MYTEVGEQMAEQNILNGNQKQLKQFDEKTITLIINEEEITIERSNISSMKRAFKWE